MTGAEPIEQVAQVGTLGVPPLLVEADDGIGGGGGFGVRRPRKASAQDGQDFFAIDHWGHAAESARAARPGRRSPRPAGLGRRAPLRCSAVAMAMPRGGRSGRVISRGFCA